MAVIAAAANSEGGGRVWTGPAMTASARPRRRPVEARVAAAAAAAAAAEPDAEASLAADLTTWPRARADAGASRSSLSGAPAMPAAPARWRLNGAAGCLEGSAAVAGPVLRSTRLLSAVRAASSALGSACSAVREWKSSLPTLTDRPAEEPRVACWEEGGRKTTASTRAAGSADCSASAKRQTCWGRAAMGSHTATTGVLAAAAHSPSSDPSVAERTAANRVPPIPADAGSGVRQRAETPCTVQASAPATRSQHCTSVAVAAARAVPPGGMARWR
mmetsp:Transcript_15018/g.56603  ORF Transcript_15018/g.56603 Transcript_15018/m.56603 type:complete len:275 (-) Transcript_15018:2048-2872(-)